MTTLKPGRTIVALLIFWLSGCDGIPEVTETGKVFKIAFIGGEEQDADVLEGILAANEAEPLLNDGDRLEIIRIPQTDPESGIAVAIKQHIVRDPISAILLGGSSKTVLPARHDIDALRIPTLAVTATHPDVTEQMEFISQLSFDDDRQGQAAALFVRDELALQRAAVFFDDVDPHSGYLGQIFRTTFEKAGGQMGTFSVVSRLDQAMLQRLKDLDMQILYVPLDPKQILRLLVELETLSWYPVIMGADGLLAGTKQEFPQQLQALNGIYVTDLYSHSSQFVNVAKFVKKISGIHEQMFNDNASTDTALGVEGYQLIKTAMNACPDRNNGNCINRKIRSTKHQQGMVSRFSMLANGKASRPIYISTIQNGQLELVVKVN